MRGGKRSKVSDFVHGNIRYYAGTDCCAAISGMDAAGWQKKRYKAESTKLPLLENMRIDIAIVVTISFIYSG